MRPSPHRKLKKGPVARTMREQPGQKTKKPISESRAEEKPSTRLQSRRSSVFWLLSPLPEFLGPALTDWVYQALDRAPGSQDWFLTGGHRDQGNTAPFLRQQSFRDKSAICALARIPTHCLRRSSRGDLFLVDRNWVSWIARSTQSAHTANSGQC